MINPPSFGWPGDDFDVVDEVAGIIDGVGAVEVGMEEVGGGVSDDILKCLYLWPTLVCTQVFAESLIFSHRNFLFPELCFF